MDGDDVALKPEDNMPQDLQDQKVEEYEIWSCPKCRYELWLALSIVEDKMPLRPALR
jgi:hypothetical protein